MQNPDSFYEVDPNRLDGDANAVVVVNRKNLEVITQKIFNSIVSSVDRFPSQVGNHPVDLFLHVSTHNLWFAFLLAATMFVHLSVQRHRSALPHVEPHQRCRDRHLPSVHQPGYRVSTT